MDKKDLASVKTGLDALKRALEPWLTFLGVKYIQMWKTTQPGQYSVSFIGMGMYRLATVIFRSPS